MQGTGVVCGVWSLHPRAGSPLPAYETPTADRRVGRKEAVPGRAKRAGLTSPGALSSALVNTSALVLLSPQAGWAVPELPEERSS